MTPLQLRQKGIVIGLDRYVFSVGCHGYTKQKLLEPQKGTVPTGHPLDVTRRSAAPGDTGGGRRDARARYAVNKQLLACLSGVWLVYARAHAVTDETGTTFYSRIHPR